MDRCETCSHWGGSPSSYAAPCGLGQYPARVPFDCTCDKHSSKAQPPPAAPDMQSQTRGIVQMWQARP